MGATMTILVPDPTGYGGVRHVAVSLPRIDTLVADMPGKYVVPESPTNPEVRTDVPSVRRGRWTSHHNRSLIKRRLA
jgi:hypothetical protein